MEATKTQHTPGPYTIGRGPAGEPRAILDQLGRIIAVLPSGNGGDVDYRLGSPYIPDTIAANADLFIAAPELLEAAKATVRFFEHGRMMVEVLRDLKAAIRKAEGE